MDLDKWWLDIRANDKTTRLAKEAAEKDPGYPATYGDCLGRPTPHPWSACVGAINRIQKILDMNVTAKSLRKAWNRE